MNYLILVIITFSLSAFQSKSVDQPPSLGVEPTPDSTYITLQENNTPDFIEDPAAINEQTDSIDRSFYFSIKTNGSGYNSQTKKLWRLYSGGVKKYYSITLTTDELQAIYEVLVEGDFTAFPNAFAPTTDNRMLVTPSFRYQIEANLGGELTTSIYDNEETDAAMREAAKPFLAMYNAIWEIINANADVQKLPKSNVNWE